MSGGVVQQFGGLSTYIAGPPHAKSAVILISDIFGYEVPNLRKVADKVGTAGFYAVVPDFFRGDPYVPEQKPVSEWIKNHGHDQGVEDAKHVIEALKSKGITKIGVAGFCWGGVVGVKLAAFDYVQAVVILHPGVITEEQINEVKTPLAILGAERDHTSPAEHLKKLGHILSAKSEVDSFVKIYPGVEHGWTTRYNEKDEFAVKSAEEAYLDMLNWLSKYIN